MTDRQAISILECMAIDMTGALGDMGKFNPLTDVIMQRLDAINFCQDILCAQAEAEKNEPLTLDELRELDGEPVWVMCLYDKSRSGWCLVDSDGDVYNDCYSFYDDSYGETWLAYRSKPEEAEL